MSNEETVTIPKSEYEYLQDRLYFLNCLESMGVDNWSGYPYAREEYDEGKDEEESKECC